MLCREHLIGQRCISQFTYSLTLDTYHEYFFIVGLLSRYSERQKSMDGYLIRMKWPYFQSLKNIRSTARKALKLFWLNAQHSEVFKMVCYVLLARLHPTQSCLEVTKNLLFFSKNDKKQAIFAEVNSS